jgi:hypothetical protein
MMKDFVEFQTVELEKLKLGLHQAVSENALLMDPRIEVVRDQIIGHIVAKVQGYIWSEQLETWDVKYPSDWWQAFKERWAPKWAKKRWPVEYQYHRYELKALYPEFKVSVPEQKYRLHLFASDWKL